MRSCMWESGWGHLKESEPGAGPWHRRDEVACRCVVAFGFAVRMTENVARTRAHAAGRWRRHTSAVAHPRLRPDAAPAAPAWYVLAFQFPRPPVPPCLLASVLRNGAVECHGMRCLRTTGQLRTHQAALCCAGLRRHAVFQPRPIGRIHPIRVHRPQVSEAVSAVRVGLHCAMPSIIRSLISGRGVDVWMVGTHTATQP